LRGTASTTNLGAPTTKQHPASAGPSRAVQPMGGMGMGGMGGMDDFQKNRPKISLVHLLQKDSKTLFSVDFM